MQILNDRRGWLLDHWVSRPFIFVFWHLWFRCAVVTAGTFDRDDFAGRKFLNIVWRLMKVMTILMISQFSLLFTF